MKVFPNFTIKRTHTFHGAPCFTLLLDRQTAHCRSCIVDPKKDPQISSMKVELTCSFLPSWWSETMRDSLNAALIKAQHLFKPIAVSLRPHPPPLSSPLVPSLISWVTRKRRLTRQPLQTLLLLGALLFHPLCKHLTLIQVSGVCARTSYRVCIDFL